MTAHAEMPAGSRTWSTWFPRVLWIVALGLVIWALRDYLLGIPDRYHNENARSLSIALFLFLSNVADEFRSTPWIGWTLKIASIIPLGTLIYYTA